MNNERKPIAIIAAQHFIYRLGIKTITGVIGVDLDVYEASSFLEIKEYLTNQSCDFIIIDEHILEADKNDLQSLKLLCPQCKYLVFCDSLNSRCEHPHAIHPTDSQKKTLEKLQKFFFEPEEDNESQDPTTDILSEREIEVLKKIALGYANKEIADLLYISINTVITHRKNITEKLGIKTIAGLTVFAIMNNFIKPDDVKH
ncbi:response regulator transcription factor [Puteibacter caeruleilacunae]|nr:response regulator transcription factor [Puteibacter caeruleilacunae]